MDINPELRTLFQRAIVDPASITPAEKNDMFWLPSPGEENQLHQSAFNLSSRAALIANALADDGAALSDPEARTSMPSVYRCFGAIWLPNWLCVTYIPG